MADGEAYFDYLKSETYAGYYLDKYPLANGDRDIIAQMVPTNPVVTVDDFFGPRVCNVIILTGNYDWDAGTVATAKTRLIATYPFFTKYETHVIVDDSSPNISCMDTGTKSDLLSRLTALCSDLSAYGFTFEGNLSGSGITSAIDRILGAFYAAG